MNSHTSIWFYTWKPNLDLQIGGRWVTRGHIEHADTGMVAAEVQEVIDNFCKLLSI